MISILIALIIFGLVLWLIQSYLPIPEPIKSIIIIVVVLILIFYLLSMVGVVGPVRLNL